MTTIIKTEVDCDISISRDTKLYLSLVFDVSLRAICLTRKEARALGKALIKEAEEKN